VAVAVELIGQGMPLTKLVDLVDLVVVVAVAPHQVRLALEVLELPVKVMLVVAPTVEVRIMAAVAVALAQQEIMQHLVQVATVATVQIGNLLGLCTLVAVVALDMELTLELHTVMEVVAVVAVEVTALLLAIEMAFQELQTQAVAVAVALTQLLPQQTAALAVLA
jgi:hypothetical protein